VNRQAMSANTVRCAIETDGQVRILILYRLYKELLQYIRARHMQGSPD